MDKGTNIGKRIAKLRKHRKLHQSVVADYLHISISTLSNYENNVHEPNLETLIQLADFFDVSTDYLLGRTNHTCPIHELERPLWGNVTLCNLIETTHSMEKDDLFYLRRTFAMLDSKRLIKQNQRRL